MERPLTPPPAGTGHAADATLAAQAAAGDTRAFEALMRRHNRLLFRSARGVVGDDAEAQDIVQETWLRAHARLGSYRGDAALGTWLARIAINLALDALRRRGRTVAWDEEADMASEDATADDDAHAPEGTAQRHELRALLESAIGGLPPPYRSVFMLRAVEELSVDETAAALQVSGDVVKTRYLRARTMLRDALAARALGQAQDVFPFAGARCDALVAAVLAALPPRRSP